VGIHGRILTARGQKFLTHTSLSDVRHISMMRHFLHSGLRHPSHTVTASLVWQNAQVFVFFSSDSTLDPRKGFYVVIANAMPQ
jgi:hypothetical protein